MGEGVVGLEHLVAVGARDEAEQVDVALLLLLARRGSGPRRRGLGAVPRFCEFCEKSLFYALRNFARFARNAEVLPLGAWSALALPVRPQMGEKPGCSTMA